MSKEFGHTGTLFKKYNRFYWSYKYDHCIECGGVQFKHKGRGLCTSCHDKKRSKKPERKKATNAIKEKWQIENKEQYMEFQRRYKREVFYPKWKTAILAIAKGKRRHKKGLPCVQYMNVFLPFETIAKPFVENFTCTEKEYEDWKKNMEIFESVKNYLNR